MTLQERNRPRPQSGVPSHRDRATGWASTHRVHLGMPHLAFSGLSEAWLLKELGHRHWIQLARMAEYDFPDFYDEAGHTVYAAFRSVRIEGARFDLAKENDTLVIRSSLFRLSRTQVQSEHRLSIGGALLGVVRMVSVFVHRNGQTSNRSVVRVEIQGLPPVSEASKPDLANGGVDGTVWSWDEGAIVAADHRPQLFFPCPSRTSTARAFSTSQMSRPSSTGRNGTSIRTSRAMPSPAGAASPITPTSIRARRSPSSSSISSATTCCGGTAAG